MATEKGLAVTIRGFIEINPRNLSAHRAALDAVMAVQEGDLSAIQDMLKIEDFKADPVTRRVKGDDPDQGSLGV